MVTCAACHRHYRCTPSSDYYNNSTFDDGVCEACLLRGEKGAVPPSPDPLDSPLIQRMIESGEAVVIDGQVSIGPPLQPKPDPQ